MERLRKALAALSAVYAIVFFAAAAVHTGVWIQPLIVPAVIAETLCGLAMLLGAYRRTWDTIIWTHAFALAGVLLGVLSQGIGAAPDTTWSIWYHDIMAALLALGLGGALYVSRERT
ncbi:MAG: hypothetical protein HOY71_39605 [Nonomuraea sp.]|nr:hypothetical protein [Nonomuraea sp.]